MMTFKDDWHSGRFVNCIYLYLMGWVYIGIYLYLISIFNDLIFFSKTSGYP